jgi:hypothetical protein
VAESGPHWQQSPPELIDRFGMVLERFPELEQRKMFGYPAAFAASGHMVTGLHGSSWTVRLDDFDRATLRAAGGEDFEPVLGRPMKGFLVLPDDVVASDDALADWIERAQWYVNTLRPKKPKKPKTTS